MVLIDKEEIVKVAAYLFGRVHRSVYIEIIALRERRKDVGKGLCLYPRSHRQFVVDTVFLELLFLISLDLNADDNVIQISCGNDSCKDDELKFFDKSLDPDRNKRQQQIEPKCWCKPLVYLGFVSYQKIDTLTEHQYVHGVGKHITGIPVIDVHLIEIVIELWKNVRDKTHHVAGQKEKEDIVDGLGTLSGICQEKYQERKQIDHETWYGKLHKSGSLDQDREHFARMSADQHPDEMHWYVDIDQGEKDLKISSYLFADMHSGSDLDYAQTADAEACCDKYDIDDVKQVEIKYHIRSPAFLKIS